MTIAGCGWKLLFARLRVSLPSHDNRTCERKMADSWQCEWTQSHKNKNLRVKVATHGIANKLNRMMSTIACLECHPSGDWDVLYMRLHGSKDAFVTILLRGMRLKHAILWDCVVRVPQITKLARETRLTKTSPGGAARTASHDIGAI